MTADVFYNLTDSVNVVYVRNLLSWRYQGTGSRVVQYCSSLEQPSGSDSQKERMPQREFPGRSRPPAQAGPALPLPAGRGGGNRAGAGRRARSRGAGARAVRMLAPPRAARLHGENMAPFPEEVDVFSAPHWRMKQLVGLYCDKVAGRGGPRAAAPGAGGRVWGVCSCQRPGPASNFCPALPRGS